MLWLVRLGISLLPFRVMHALPSRLTERRFLARRKVPPARIIRGIDAASRFVLSPTCLVRALAAQVLLRLCGHDGVLHLGVARNESGRIDAHAWLECQGRVVIGGESGQFVPLPPIRMDE